MKLISQLLIAAAVILILPVALYDPMDDATALFRYGKDGRPATTEEILQAQEIPVPPNPNAWLWKPALACGLAGALGLLVSRRKR